MNLQTPPNTSYSMRAMPDSCQFQLLDVDLLQDPGTRRIVHLYSMVARCLRCETVFKAVEGQGLVSMSATRVLRCPTGCGQQSLKGATLRSWQPAPEATA